MHQTVIADKQPGVLLLLPLLLLLLCMTFSLSNLHHPITLSSTKSDA